MNTTIYEEYKVFNLIMSSTEGFGGGGVKRVKSGLVLRS